MIEVSLSLIGRDVTKNIVENLFALGHETDSIICNTLHDPSLLIIMFFFSNFEAT